MKPMTCPVSPPSTNIIFPQNIYYKMLVMIQNKENIIYRAFILSSEMYYEGNLVTVMRASPNLK